MSTVIENFHEILFMPMVYRAADPNGKKFPELVKEWGCWEDEEKDFFHRADGLPEKADDQEIVRYGEFVFYHPFVQRFLYGEKDSAQSLPVRVWQRKGKPASVSVLLKKEDKDHPDFTETRAISVKRTTLYWFNLDDQSRDEFGIAILAVEVARKNLGLQYTEEFLDRFRQLYPPYFDCRLEQGGRVPQQVIWHGEQGQPLSSVDGKADDSKCLDWVKEKRKYPMLSHWRWLLTGNAEVDSFKGLEIMEDDRLPFMAWLALENPRQLTQPDFVRLCFADSAGSSNSFPYAPAFLEDFERKHCYDRYWEPMAANGYAWMNTRYLNSGYGFVAVGQEIAERQNSKDFFVDDVSGVLSHFRNHYFIMGLILHFQKTALLAFSDRLSRNIARLGGGNTSVEARKEAADIMSDMLHFTGRYWFDELTNQEQGQELHELWRRHLKLERLYERVTHEAEQVNHWLDAKNDLEMNEKQTSLADDASRFTTVATIGMMIGLMIAMLSAKEWLASIGFWDEKDGWPVFRLAVMILIPGVVGITIISGPLRNLMSKLAKFFK